LQWIALHFRNRRLAGSRAGQKLPQSPFAGQVSRENIGAMP
jgi:hypothetical protein